VNVGPRRHVWEVPRGESEREGVAHGVDEDVRHEKREGVVRENQRAQRLAEQCEAWPCAAEDPMPCIQVEEVNCRCVEAYVEAIMDALEYGRLVDIVVTCVDDADGFGPALLGCADCSPEDSFAAASCIAEISKH
jgi:hypothetical protein